VRTWIASWPAWPPTIRTSGTRSRFPPQGFTEPFVVDPQSPVVRAARDAHHRVTGRPAVDNRSLLTAASDASWLAHAGIPGVIYGPAGKYLSRPDERVHVEDIVTRPGSTPS
jgi:acetylornithine deacetylase/succinyl-diaminopimelate desuccinylase-like protein